MLKDCNLYLILDTEVAHYDQLLKIAEDGLRGGVTMVQLRDKKGRVKDILDFSKRVRKLLKDKVSYIINDRTDLVLAVGANGVHLGQDDLPVTMARKILGKKAIIGASCQTFAQAKEAQRQGADYIGFGSVFKTLTKPHREPMDLSVLARVIREIEIPVFAIGGINIHNVWRLCGIGVQRIAVCRSLCESPNVTDTARSLIMALGQ